MQITENLIQEEAARLLSLMAPQIRAWATPLNSVVLRDLPQSLSKTIFGLANPNGDIHVSRLFVGTTHLEGLRETLIREFCHMITGLEHAHNSRFKRNLSCLLSIAGVDEMLASNQKRQLVNSVKQQPKYNLIAVCFDGSEIEMGEFHKKTKKYTGYVPGTNPWKVDNKAIHEFKFIARS